MKNCANKNCKEINPQPLNNFHKKFNKLKSRCKSCRHLEYHDNKINQKNNHLKKQFGVSLNFYNDLINKQNYKCEICGIDRKFSGKKGLVIDHNHENNQIRGLICGPCNSALGLFKDNIQSLINAIQYLEFYENLGINQKTFIFENKMLLQLRGNNDRKVLFKQTMPTTKSTIYK